MIKEKMKESCKIKVAQFYEAGHLEENSEF